MGWKEEKKERISYNVDDEGAESCQLIKEGIWIRGEQVRLAVDPSSNEDIEEASAE